MDSNAGNSQKHTPPCTGEHEDDKCAKCGCCSGERLKEMKVLIKKLEDIECFKKYLDFFKTMLTAVKKLNGHTQASGGEVRDPLSIVDHLKGLLADMEKGAKSSLPAEDSSALYQKHRELIEKFSQLDDVLNKVERIFSAKTLRILTDLFDDCQKKMLKFQIGWKEIQYVEAMEGKVTELITEKEKLFSICKSQSNLNARLLDIQEILHDKYESLQDKYESLVDAYESSNNRFAIFDDELAKIKKYLGQQKRRSSL